MKKKSYRKKKRTNGQIKSLAITLILLLPLGYLLQLWAPWWSITLLCGIVAFSRNNSPRQAFWHSFIAIFILWGGLAAVFDLANEAILATRMGNLFGGIPHWGMVILTGIIGGIIGGLAAYATANLRRALT